MRKPVAGCRRTGNFLWRIYKNLATRICDDIVEPTVDFAFRIQSVRFLTCEIFREGLFGRVGGRRDHRSTGDLLHAEQDYAGYRVGDRRFHDDRSRFGDSGRLSLSVGLRGHGVQSQRLVTLRS